VQQIWARFARRLRRNHQGFGDTLLIDEVFVKIQGKQHYLWRAVDQDGKVSTCFFRKGVMPRLQRDSLGGC